jgi:hypothetical protein
MAKPKKDKNVTEDVQQGTLGAHEDIDAQEQSSNAQDAQKPRYPLAVVMQHDHILQRGMPGRPELMVTNNLKAGHKVTDPHLIKVLIDDGAPVIRS